MSEHPWRYAVQYGPDGEADYSWVFTGEGEMVCVAKTHHAAAIVAAMNFLTVPDFEAHPTTTQPQAVS